MFLRTFCDYCFWAWAKIFLVKIIDFKRLTSLCRQRPQNLLKVQLFGDSLRQKCCCMIISRAKIYKKKILHKASPFRAAPFEKMHKTLISAIETEGKYFS